MSRQSRFFKRRIRWRSFCKSLKYQELKFSDFSDGGLPQGRRFCHKAKWGSTAAAACF